MSNARFRSERSPNLPNRILATGLRYAQLAEELLCVPGGVCVTVIIEVRPDAITALGLDAPDPHSQFFG